MALPRTPTNGVKYQGKWQAIAGLSLLFSFVIIPTSLDYVTAYKEKRFTAGFLGNNSIQKMVHAERLKLRENNTKS
jgi:hypothetical protein